MIQITQTGLTAQPEAIERLALEFRNSGIGMLPRFIAPQILRPLLASVSRSKFALKKERYIDGQTLHVGMDEPALASIYFMLNRSELYNATSRITGIPGLCNFTSRLHRTVADPDLHLDWHDDSTEGRLVGLNISLNESCYEGGLLQLRGPDGIMRCELGRLIAGDAFLFKIGNGWEHRLTPVTNGVRTVAVGWFRSYPDWIANASQQVRAALVA